MRTTKVLSVSLPPEMLSWAEEVARSEHRTMSELVREALRAYRQNRFAETKQQPSGQNQPKGSAKNLK
jgi:Arc/MetJ-type ribon-helix-helix transcriptional regulator